MVICTSMTSRDFDWGLNEASLRKYLAKVWRMSRVSWAEAEQSFTGKKNRSRRKAAAWELKESTTAPWLWTSPAFLRCLSARPCFVQPELYWAVSVKLTQILKADYPNSVLDIQYITNKQVYQHKTPTDVRRLISSFSSATVAMWPWARSLDPAGLRSSFKSIILKAYLTGSLQLWICSLRITYCL